eukprot:gnl/TRDRNA2_/TRDRNA2_169920_c0_seq1.p1 gnl/TRDRNA2_/TRDRNA2_169920_c0~~gnl/TRDRNA2_/TRDRNA2_169920_c0_seq1.p1  ORF type:complete len:941 (-),score=209.34 gnl/TRDRNA2_/TRDRNA2_169920_c0_seq1:47-2521(-)
MFDFPAGALKKPFFVTEEQWSILEDSDCPASETASVAAAIVKAFVMLAQEEHARQIRRSTMLERKSLVAKAPPSPSPPAPRKYQTEDGGSDDELPEHMVVTCPTAKRVGVSAEATQNEEADNWVPPVYEKSEAEREQLSDIINSSEDSKMQVLFGNCSKETFEKILDAMFTKKVPPGESVMEQGGVGDYFYVVKFGSFDIMVKKGDEPPKKVFTAGAGFAFGELALLYNAPRTATITSTKHSEVWCLDRTSFRRLVVRSSEARFKRCVQFLQNIDIFQVLSEHERASLAEVLEEEEFENDEAILEQDEKDDKMFIVREGNAVACISGDKGEVEVMQYSKGDYFGEIALLLGEPRKASVYAVGHCSTYYITRQTFKRILGPLQDLLSRKMDSYQKYASAIDRAQQDEGAEGEPADGSAVKVRAAKKRERPMDAGLVNISRKSIKDETPEGPVCQLSLADKVAQDLKNPELAEPSPAFNLPDSDMLIYGGMIAGQKFTNNKKVILRTQAVKPASDGEDDIYSWRSATKFPGLTAHAVVSQKGQKSADDPTPNQDNWFVHHINGVAVYGVADGHGPFGHLVSFRLCQSLPFYLAKSQYFAVDWEAALKEAFKNAHNDLLSLGKSQDINLEASGAAGSVLILDEQTIHIGYIGDARIFLGSWNRRSSKQIFCTKDHKPQNEEERKRLEAAGSEVREIDAESYRIYLPGTSFPGLTMSRAFGDTACGGVLQEPEYHKFQMQPSDEYYAIIASDGIWEFIEGEDAANLTTKKLRLKGPQETLNFLVGASRKRWAHMCGEYCDDITGVLVQWNSKEKMDGQLNHQLTIKRA